MVGLQMPCNFARTDPFALLECRRATHLDAPIAVVVAQRGTDCLRDPLLAQVRKVLIASKARLEEQTSVERYGAQREGKVFGPNGPDRIPGSIL